ncbi:hypothetical protein JCM11641_005351, partial [Rhodosporidiobolus odoratus]
PRYEDHGKTRGKGLWVTCSREAVEGLANKGSYKRLHPAAQLPSSAADHVASLLARRVVQEVEMFAERAKSWPGPPSSAGAEDTGFCPVRRLSKGAWDEERQKLDAAGRGNEMSAVAAVLDLSLPTTGAEQPFVTTVLVEGRRAPVYHLASFFANIRLPPSLLASSIPSAPSSSAPTSATEALFETIRKALDGVVDLWERRRTRTFTRVSDQNSPTSPPIPPSSRETYSAYLIYAPTSSRQSASSFQASSSESPAAKSPTAQLRRRQADDIVPLLVALRRCIVWLGEDGETE